MTFSIDNFETGGQETSKGNRGFAGETILELVENEAGQIVLRESDNVDDPLVTIDFSKKCKKCSVVTTNDWASHGASGDSGGDVQANQPMACQRL